MGDNQNSRKEYLTPDISSSYSSCCSFCCRSSPSCRSSPCCSLSSCSLAFYYYFYFFSHRHYHRHYPNFSPYLFVVFISLVILPPSSLLPQPRGRRPFEEFFSSSRDSNGVAKLGSYLGPVEKLGPLGFYAFLQNACPTA
jgi:hypothetical protein